MYEIKVIGKLVSEDTTTIVYKWDGLGSITFATFGSDFIEENPSLLDSEFLIAIFKGKENNPLCSQS
jgi:hypothetical protein